MKKQFTLLILIILTFRLFGQLNPINDLSFEHWHDYESSCPSYNCFTLYWNEPDSSFLDTLIGYNIYRNSEFWRFQDYIGAECVDGMSPCPDESFFGYPAPFWVKLKAVYNSALLESPALDSALFGGVMTGLGNFHDENEKIYPNPTSGIINIDFENIKKIVLLNSSGTKIQVLNDKSHIDLSIYPRGIYYIKIISDRKIRIKKVVLE